MARAEASITIDRPVEEVFAFASNFEKHEEWGSVVSGVVKTSEGPLGVGTSYRGTAQFLGRQMEWTSEVTEFQPPEKVAFSLW